VKNFGNILDYNFTAKVEQDFDETERKCGLVSNEEFYDQFHPTVKMSRLMPSERVENVFLVLIQEQVKVSVRLGNLVPWLKLVMPKTKTKKFASLMNEQNIGTITLKRH
jgi:DNA topoisomerase-1